MPITITWLDEPRIMEYRLQGVVTRADLAQALAQSFKVTPAGVLLDCAGLLKSPSNLMAALIAGLNGEQVAVVQAETSSSMVGALLSRSDLRARSYPTRQAALDALRHPEMLPSP